MAQWVTFDLDGTLSDSPFERIVMPWIVERLEAAGIQEARERLFHEQQKRFAAGQRVAGFHWDDIAATVLAEVGQPLDAAIVDALSAAPLAEQARAYTLYDDVPQALHALREQGFALAVVTNGHARYQQALFELMGVADEFALMIGPDIVGCAKPDPAIFSWPVLAQQVWMHVGDLLTQDVRAAREAGIKAVLVARELAWTAGEWADVTHALAAMSPTARPAAALATGWLDACLHREYAFLRRTVPPERLTPQDTHVPDAIVFSFAELVPLASSAAWDGR